MLPNGIKNNIFLRTNTYMTITFHMIWIRYFFFERKSSKVTEIITTNTYFSLIMLTLLIYFLIGFILSSLQLYLPILNSYIYELSVNDIFKNKSSLGLFMRVLIELIFKYQVPSNSWKIQLPYYFFIIYNIVHIHGARCISRDHLHVRLILYFTQNNRRIQLYSAWESIIYFIRDDEFIILFVGFVIVIKINFKNFISYKLLFSQYYCYYY